MDKAHADGKQRRLETGPRMMVLALLHAVLALKQQQPDSSFDPLIVQLLEKDLSKMATSFNTSQDNALTLLHDTIRSAYELAKSESLIDVRFGGARLQPVANSGHTNAYNVDPDSLFILECTISLEECKNFDQISKPKTCQHKFSTVCLDALALPG